MGFYDLLKSAADVEIYDRKNKPELSFAERVLAPTEKNLKPIAAEDTEQYQRIADYMTASRPYELGHAKVYANRVPTHEVLDQLTRAEELDASDTQRDFGEYPLAALQYLQLSPDEYEQMPASWHPYLNSVFLNQNNKGTAIHELGHAIDLSPREDESLDRKDLRQQFKPLLLQERDAWRKGRQAYQEGYAADPMNQGEGKTHDEYIEIMDEYNRTKYPAFGTYLGGTVGSLGGAAAAMGAVMYIAKENGGISPLLGGALIFAGAASGSTLGIFSGLAAGKAWGEWRKDANKEKSLRQLQSLQEDPEALKEVTLRLVEVKKKSKKNLAKHEKNVKRIARDEAKEGKRKAKENKEEKQTRIKAANRL